MTPVPSASPEAALGGTWVGGGEGSYPTIAPFTYAETVTLTPVPGKPLLSYSQRTTHPDTGAPMHAEVGYLRFPTSPTAGGYPGVAELVVAQPTGVTENHTGTVTAEGDRLVIDLATTAVGLTPTAKEVTSVRRRIVVDGNVLTYELWMAAVGQADTLHLRAELERQSDS